MRSLVANPRNSLLVTSESYYVANGAESAVYRCYTDDIIEIKARDLHKDGSIYSYQTF